MGAASRRLLRPRRDVVDRIGRFTTEMRVPDWPVCGAASRVVAADVLLTRDQGTCCGSGATDAQVSAEVAGECVLVRSPRVTADPGLPPAAAVAAAVVRSAGLSRLHLRSTSLGWG